MPSTIQTTIWPIEPHTLAKHEILRRYLGAWFPILSSHNGRILYMDGFCGPGEYQAGERGSPIIALDVADSVVGRGGLSGEVVFWFVEQDHDRIEHLRGLLQRRTMPSNFQVHVEEGRFDEVLTSTLDHLASNNLTIAPTFAFIDPFGFSGVPMSLMHRLLSQPRTETFVTFMIESVNRFIEHPNKQIRAHVVELFGTDRVLSIIDGSSDRFENLRKLYQEQLGLAAKHVRYFNMRNDRDVPLYDLFFASNNELGHVRMKEAMWKVDPKGSYTFSDATNPGQLVLFSGDYTSSLLRNICLNFSDQSTVSTKVIRLWVERNTAFLATHMKAALGLGETEAILSVRAAKANGKPRRGHTFPDEVLIDFPSAT